MTIFMQPYGELLYLTRSLAALLHDIGKATAAFQGKMTGIYAHEEYRHDLVGFLMLRSLFAENQIPQDSFFLETLAEQTALWTDAEKLFSLPENTVAIELQQAPIFSLISWLVLSHHRLPEGINKLELKSHINSPESTWGEVAKKDISQQAANGGLPWQESTWQAQVGDCAKRIIDLLNTYPDLNTDLKNQTGDWILANVHFNRPLLIAADHLASIQCNQSDELWIEKQVATIAYANTSKAYWGDTVSQHLRRVEKVSGKLKTLLENPQQFRHASLPAASLVRTPIAAESRYYWQQLLAQSAQENLAGKPVFAAILAETGSGKTLAAVRLLDAISPRSESGETQLRYTLALGLRALTLQSGVAMRDQAKIAEEDFPLNPP